MNTGLLALFCLLQAADVYTTLTVLKQGGRELNPVLAKLFVKFDPPSPGAFADFDALTEAQVLGWVWISGVDKDSAEASLAAQIEAQRNPPVVAPPLPWAA